MISGFTIVRNAVKLDYPIVPAIRSILDICDEVVVNVGRSDDETRDLVMSVGDPRVRILDTEWDFGRQSLTLSFETQRAMDACRGTWGVCIQADEVLHEAGAVELRQRMAECDGDGRVEGLLVRYRHFWGNFETLATTRRYYRREVRCVRLGRGVRSFQDAQGFRVGPELRRIRARATDAEMFHYGWARPVWAIGAKYQASQTIFPWSGERSAAAQARRTLGWMPLLRRFAGAHPRAVQEWIAAREREPMPELGPKSFRLGFVRYYVSDWIERLTGVRVFEYRNYVEV
ncbi:MAG TPA: hypothetical protein VFI66_02025 [Gemmatimonadales bacterium]|nr:hypothetical protein [Gemmatimonadales bacterium]